MQYYYEGKDDARKRKRTFTFLFFGIVCLVLLLRVPKYVHGLNQTNDLKDSLLNNAMLLIGVEFEYDKITGFYEDDNETLNSDAKILTVHLGDENLQKFISAMEAKYEPGVLPIEDAGTKVLFDKLLGYKEGKDNLEIGDSGKFWVFELAIPQDDTPEGKNHGKDVTLDLPAISENLSESGFLYVQPNEELGDLKIWYQFNTKGLQEAEASGE